MQGPAGLSLAGLTAKPAKTNRQRLFVRERFGAFKGEVAVAFLQVRTASVSTYRPIISAYRNPPKSLQSPSGRVHNFTRAAYK